MRRILVVAVAAGALLPLSAARADDAPSTQPAVSRQEFEDLKKENAEIKRELANLKKSQDEQAANAAQDAADVDKSLKDIQKDIDSVKPGLEGFTVVGDANIGFNAQRHSDSTFFADVSPLILWRPPDSHLLVETAFDLGIGGSDVNSETTTVTLNLADISYAVNDNLIVGGGLFTVPFGQYHNHFDPPWVNKFPDDPLAFDAISPISEVGFFAKGVVPSGTTKWTYHLYPTNGPNLITTDPNAAGQLNFNDYTDLNNNKAVGGRLGFIPFPDTELGYSIQYSQPNPDGFPHVYACLQAVDFHHKPLVRSLGGVFDLSAEWVWSNVSTATYDPTHGLGFGPLMFDNFRQGGYVSLGYRPTEVDSKFIQNLEFLVRYDTLQSSISSPGGERETRWTLGVDYWVTSYCVIKAAYEFDQRTVSPNQNAFILQLGYGL